MDEYRAILHLIKEAQQPRGWYNISIRLGNKGIVLKSRLIPLLDELVNLGYLDYDPSLGTHGVYTITDKGSACLDNR